MIRKLLRKISPRWLIATGRNCGGFNRNTSLFAGKLADKEITDEEWLKLVNALIFYNGVRKSTKFWRNAPVLEKLLSDKTLQWNNKPIRVLDIGSSVGIDAIGNLEVLEKYTEVNQYVLGDLFTALEYDVSGQKIFDQDGRLVQILLDNCFVNLNFEFKYYLEPVFHILNLIKTWKIRNRNTAITPPAGGTIPIPLIYPPVIRNPLFHSSRINVFEPLDEKFDLIICMNLLQTRYFSRSMIELGNMNLAGALTSGGILVTGVTDSYRIIKTSETLKEAQAKH